MADPSIERRWEAELEKRGLATVTLYLASDQAVGISPGAEVRLFVPGLENPPRYYVEGWIGRKGAETARLAEARHRETLTVGQKSVRGAFWATVMGAISVILTLAFGLLGK